MNQTLKQQFSVFTLEQKQAIRIALWSKVVEMERDDRTDNPLYKTTCAMFDYLDYELNT